MHRGVPDIRNPGLLVHHRKPPIGVARASEMIEPGHRTIVDIEGEALFGQAAERQADRRLDRAAMTNRNHIVARLFDRDALDRTTYAGVEVHETLAARRRLVDIGKPVAAGRAAGEERGTIHTLPLPEMLFRESRLLRHRRRLWEATLPDRVRGLMRAHQVARIPDRTARQDFRHRLEHFAITGIAGNILLAVDVAAIAAHRRVA